jgi:succinate-semialdehyde dehydrogenase/glutarate-semialdehyde dehydrogenase
MTLPTSFATLHYPALLKHSSLINHVWQSTDTPPFTVFNPATRTALAQVHTASEAQVSHAIDVAHQALADWRTTTGTARSRLLRRWFNLIIQHENNLAQLLTLEQGKPLAEALAEIRYGASYIEWFAEEAKRIQGDVLTDAIEGKRGMVLKTPVGVCAAITPWNFPNAMVTRKIAPALAAGCTVILKPAEQTPLSALALGQLAIEAGFPAGVLNIIIGDQHHAPRIGQQLCDDVRIRKLSFTGSTEVGKILMRQCASTVKRLSLELGGHAPMIIFADADLEAAVQGIMNSKFRNAGQTCVCTNRLYVHYDVVIPLTQKLHHAIQQLIVGDGLMPQVTQGPLIDQAALDKAYSHINDALQHGATLVCGGDTVNDLAGYFFQPTLLTDVTHEMLICREETFAPILPMIAFSDETDVIQAANRSEYGLAAYFYGRDMTQIWRVAEALDFGMIGVNTGTISSTLSPFGGVKQSGFGREGSIYGIDEYLDKKAIWMSV